jgi:cysteine desulfurase/selenocysteine lyase
MPPDFAALRKQFPTLEHWAHFDIARKAPLPLCVEASMQSYMKDVYERAGETAFSMEETDRTRETVARLVGVPAKTLAFIKNTSEGLNIAALGLGLGSVDKVLITEFEHAACVFPWRRLQTKGVEVDVVRARNGGLPVDAFMEQMDDRTRAVAVSWVAYGNGFRTDVPALAKVCRERNIVLVVDAIQAVGVLATPIAELGADVVIAGGHKGLLSHIGAGFMYCREEIIPKLEPPYAARFSFAVDDKWQEPLTLASDAHRFEYGNPNFLGIWVLKHSAEFIMSIGLPQIEQRIRELTTYLYDRAEDMGLESCTPRPWEQRAGIISFEVPDPGTVVKKLHERKFITNVKDNRYLRTATHFYNTEEEIDRLLDATMEILRGK